MNIPNVYASAVKKQQLDMTLSENPLGCSPRAMQALQQLTMKDIATYPDTSPLLAAAGKRFGVKPSCMLVGNGSEQLIKLAAQTFLKPESTALVQSGSFSVLSKECLLTDASVTLCDVNDLATQTINPDVVFLCNPNNPTGEIIPKKTINRIIAAFPNAVIVIDEANAEFSGQTTIPVAIKKQNVLILRTCSKAFGLAGLRVGFLIGNPMLVKKLNIAQQVFPISSLSVTLASAAINDRDFAEKTIAFIKKERISMMSALKKRGFIVSQSVTNTLFVSTPRAKTLIAALNDNGVSVVANTFSPGLRTPGFRIALRDTKTNRMFLQKLDAAIEQIGLNLIR
ncbi:MAG: histidinol-phosphate transaminase [Candidatus Gottesmanbacteria bacterium]